MKRYGFIRNFFLSLIVIFGFLYWLAPSAGAENKNYFFPDLRADISINKDGSFLVDEYLTFEFQGQFSWASLWIPLRARRNSDLLVEIEDFRVRDEQGQELPVQTAIERQRFQAKWVFSARNQRRTFHISYIVKKGILNYPEISELYWQIIGEEVDRPTAQAEVRVHLPEPVLNKEDILVYGHGPLSGKSEIVDNETLRFIATNTPARQFMEIRVIWPAGMVEGIPASGYTRDIIRQEEARYTRETIERIKKEREEKARTVAFFKKLGLAWVIWQLLGPLIFLAFYFYFWRKIGRDYRFSDIPEYFREMPSNLPPALVQVLRREGGKVLPVAFTATIFDLATRGFLTIEDEKVEKKTLFGTKIKDHTFFVLKKEYLQDPKLKSWEKDVLDLVFREVGEGETPSSRVSLEELVDYLKRYPTSFQSWFRDWQKDIDREARTLGFIEPESRRFYQIFMIVGLILASLTFSPVMFILSLTLSPTLRRRRKDWARENELWKALERFLEDFSDFKEIPAEAYKLWDKYLVFAILFGQAKKLVKVLPRIIQDQKATAPVWIGGSFAASSFTRQFDSIASTIASIERAASALSQASTSAAHYSSGGGGGFSGGGGGGGGGGGVSAG